MISDDACGVMYHTSETREEEDNIDDQTGEDNKGEQGRELILHGTTWYGKREGGREILLWEVLLSIYCFC